MAEEKKTARWRVIGTSVRGASHERVGTPNQDAIRWLPESEAGSPAVLAVADGHGSQRSFRSETGARLAVEVAIEVVGDFLRGQAQTESLSLTKRAAEEWLPTAIVRRWLNAVSQDLAAHPLATNELALIGGNSTPGQSLPRNPSLPYGTTILAAGAVEDFLVYLQLGDGEILTVSREGEVARPLAKDERLFANETTSLCSQDAWRDFRVCFQVVSNTPPAIVLLSTDGYPNSFNDESGFLRVGSDILEMTRADGLEAVDRHLESWLRESTYAGSGDDVTLGLMCCLEALDRGIPPDSRPSKTKTRRGRTGRSNRPVETDVSIEFEV